MMEQIKFISLERNKARKSRVFRTVHTTPSHTHVMSERPCVMQKLYVILFESLSKLKRFKRLVLRWSTDGRTMPTLLVVLHIVKCVHARAKEHI